MKGHPIAAGGPVERQSKRRDRYHARGFLWGESSLKRVRHCGRYVTSREQGVAVRVSAGEDGTRMAGFAGVQRCGSFAACPVCSAQIAEQRRSDIAAAIDYWTGKGGRVALVTLTLRHHRGQSLDWLWDTLGGAWRAATHGRGWDRDQRSLGSPIARLIKGQDGERMGLAWRIPTIRAVEVTHGVNGWHPHVHALVFLPAGTTDKQARALAGGMFERWSEHAQKYGLDAPTRRHGLDVKMLEERPEMVAEYFAKATYSVSAEMASGMQTKTAKRGGRTPFTVLADVAVRGEVDDLDLWHEWEAASKGRRMIAWSLGLRDLVRLDVERTDQEIVDEDLGGETVIYLSTVEWYQLLAEQAECDLLEALEDGHDDGMAWLAQWLARRPDDPALAA